METVAIMSKVCREAEAAMFHRVVFDELRHLTQKPTPTVTTTAIAAVDASFQQNAAAIITLATTGRYVRGRGRGVKIWEVEKGRKEKEAREEER